MTRALALISLLALAGCSGLGGAALKSAAGAALGADSGPSLDVQAGKSNNRASLGGTSSVTEQKVAPVTRDNAFNDLNQDNSQSSDTNDVSADRIENVDNRQNETWLIIAFALALFLDSPARWPGQIWRAVRPKGEKDG